MSESAAVGSTSLISRRTLRSLAATRATPVGEPTQTIRSAMAIDAVGELLPIDTTSELPGSAGSTCTRFPLLRNHTAPSPDSPFGRPPRPDGATWGVADTIWPSSGSSWTSEPTGIVLPPVAPPGGFVVAPSFPMLVTTTIAAATTMAATATHANHRRLGDAFGDV